MSSTKKPHEQIWKLGRGYEQAIPGLYIADESGCVVVSEDQIIDECMPLIACAPEMARMLLAREWGRHNQCFECGGVSFVPAERSLYHQGHKSSCAWVGLMRKAGLR